MSARATLRWTGSAAAAIVLLAPGVAAASTWTVDDDHLDCPNAGFAAIQAAIDQAAPWDTVVVCPGDYAEASAATSATNSPARAARRTG